ncbi:MAG: Dabb family protein [Rhodospirillales bacterium]|nr:Dabb family protein [Rhodospirillales bacterium]
MIRHIVMFNAEDPVDRDKIFEGLKALESIPGNWKLEVRRNLKADQLGNAIDVVVYGEFADEAALEAYKAHPIYQDTIKVVRPLRDLRIAADIEI